MNSEQPLYLSVANKCNEWNDIYQNIGLVVGGTQDELPVIRNQFPELLFLVPGVGHQGGDYQDVLSKAENNRGLALINMSRSILYASIEDNYIDVMKNKLLSYSINKV
mgnify:CR=1 FL=1